MTNAKVRQKMTIGQYKAKMITESDRNFKIDQKIVARKNLIAQLENEIHELGKKKDPHIFQRCNQHRRKGQCDKNRNDFHRYA